VFGSYPLHWLNMEIDLRNLFGLLCTAVLCNPLPPHLGSYTRGYWSAKIDDISLDPLVLPVISLVSTLHSIAVSGLPFHVMCERFRGTQKEGKRGPLSIQSFLTRRVGEEDRQSKNTILIIVPSVVS
jgi:hypothetical protein